MQQQPALIHRHTGLGVLGRCGPEAQLRVGAKGAVVLQRDGARARRERRWAREGGAARVLAALGAAVAMQPEGQPECTRGLLLERDAREKRRGLWSDTLYRVRAAEASSAPFLALRLAGATNPSSSPCVERAPLKA